MRKHQLATNTVLWWWLRPLEAAARGPERASVWNSVGSSGDPRERNRSSAHSLPALLRSLVNKR